jgi:hypothetical protein
MSTLNIARTTLLASVAVYLATLGLLSFDAGRSELLFLVSLGSIFAMAVTGVACVLLQVTALFRKRRAN